ncbi:MAG TPA: hypothetical protein VF082_02435 [Jiangellaceae bacterium]
MLGVPQTFTADVDLGTGVMEVRTDRRADGPTMVVTDDAAWLHESLFTDGSVAAEWLAMSPTRPAGGSSM